MTKEAVLAACKEKQQYTTPRLNDNLYLQCCGFTKIENLEEYTGTKTLWLEENNISKIENISHMTNLRCLFLQSNSILRISGLKSLTALQTLKLSNNMISQLENLKPLCMLHTLDVSFNLLRTVDDISHLLLCDSISALHLNSNRLEDPRCVAVLEGMRRLQVLYFSDNLAVSRIAQVWGTYRKCMIGRIPALTFLDDRPVHKNEQRYSASALFGEEPEQHEELRLPSISSQLAMQEVRERRRREIRAKRLAMGLPEEIPDCIPARQASKPSRAGEEQSPAGGGEVMYVRCPDGSLFRTKKEETPRPSGEEEDLEPREVLAAVRSCCFDFLQASVKLSRPGRVVEEAAVRRAFVRITRRAGELFPVWGSESFN